MTKKRSLIDHTYYCHAVLLRPSPDTIYSVVMKNMNQLVENKNIENWPNKHL